MRTYRLLPIFLAAAASSCSPSDDRNAAINAPAPANEVTETELPAPVSPLNREALLIATIRAASAAAAGIDDSASQRALDGQPFSLALRFGCPGSDRAGSIEQRGPADAPTVRLTGQPDLSIDHPLVAGTTAAGTLEAVNGFWITRPWMLTATCPALPQEEESELPEPDSTETKAAEARQAVARQAVAIAQFFTSDDTRAGRRSDRPYETVLTSEQSRGIVEGGFNLVLAGRLRAMDDGKVVRCTSVSPDQPPGCLISAEFDQVRMEHPVTRTVLAQWDS